MKRWLSESTTGAVVPKVRRWLSAGAKRAVVAARRHSRRGMARTLELREEEAMADSCRGFDEGEEEEMEASCGLASRVGEESTDQSIRCCRRRGGGRGFYGPVGARVSRKKTDLATVSMKKMDPGSVIEKMVDLSLLHFIVFECFILLCSNVAHDTPCFFDVAVNFVSLLHFIVF
ncbi:hypothetical protein DAI22_09g006084 [Oryza sativa Japonica Group]|nr:hypothetical protein DAI22_09g006084 [Oryza sativa Japonica Group]